TDHAPHSPGKKALGLAAAPFGVIGLETLLPLTLALVERKLLGRKAAVERLSCAPARILGLKTKGGLRPGMDADVAIVDPQARWTAGGFASKSSNTPFAGRRLRGRAWTVLLAGRPIVEEGRLTP
ncbi:MAG: dihydroorotase, partial [Elusimicrobia bacterium]|nr:dihydroorotase [Elusimicrobiota bacterium]